jgi:tetratricopeptide (TPR) repeat protein
MRIPPERSIFSSKRPPLISVSAIVMMALIGIGLLVLNSVAKGQIQPLRLITPTATRAARSFIEEGQAFFFTGNLDRAIEAYQDALQEDPENVTALTELARIQAYSSALLTAERKHDRLQTAAQNIDLAVSIDENSSDAQAVRTLVYDWYASLSTISVDERESALAEASQSAVLAVQLDNQNALAIAYRAEVLTDQGQITQARQLSELALSLEPNAMDTHRVYAYILETIGNYSKAIEEYKAATEIMPNLTFLYINIGQNYRQLQLYDQALAYFDKAAMINESLGIEDPLPYLAIAKTYTRMGEFFIAARNGIRALEFDNTNPDLYGQLGVIYYRSRNYEGSIPVLKCAVEGCTAEENEEQGVAVTGLSMTNETVVYYYIYGSVLAALDQCDKAVVVLEQVREGFSNDETIMAIVEESETICKLLKTGDETPQATATPYPDNMDAGMMEGEMLGEATATP